MMNIFDFGDIEKSKNAINVTWTEFKDCLKNKEFSIDDIESAKQITFLRVFHDLFYNHGGLGLVEKELCNVCGTLGRGTILSSDEDVDYERFLPRKEFIKNDNRFSPKGIEWLYLALGKDESIIDLVKKEIRISAGERLGYCELKFDKRYKNRKIIDLTIADIHSFESFNYEFERYGQLKLRSEVEKAIRRRRLPHESDFSKDKVFVDSIIKWAVFTYCKLLSEQIFIPLESEDRELEYAPFQTIAKYFISLGYDGIIYKSTVFANGKNIVLFKKEMAYPTGEIIDEIII